MTHSYFLPYPGPGRRSPRNITTVMNKLEPIEKDIDLPYDFTWGMIRRISNKNQTNLKDLVTRIFSTHKWPVTRKMFPFDDVIVLHPEIE